MFDKAFADPFSTVVNIPEDFICLGVGNEQISVEIRDCQARKIRNSERLQVGNWAISIKTINK